MVAVILVWATVASASEAADDLEGATSPSTATSGRLPTPGDQWFGQVAAFGGGDVGNGGAYGLGEARFGARVRESAGASTVTAMAWETVDVSGPVPWDVGWAEARWQTGGPLHVGPSLAATFGFAGGAWTEVDAGVALGGDPRAPTGVLVEPVLVARAGDGMGAWGGGLTASAVRRLGSAWLSARVEARAVDGDGWMGTLVSDARARWSGHVWALDVGGGLDAATAGATAVPIDDLPLPGTIGPHARVGVERSLPAGLAVRAELAGDLWAGSSPGTRVRALVGLVGRFGRSAPLAPPPMATPGEVVFRLSAPEALSVSVAGTFTGWTPQPLEPLGDGTWQIVVPLGPGEYEYAYVVDGATVTPPDAPLHRPDGFGNQNGVLLVGEPR